MIEVKDCLPENARKHFLNLRNVRQEEEIKAFQSKIKNLRAESAAKGALRSGWQLQAEWDLTESYLNSLASGFVDDAISTCRLYNIPITNQLCECLETATTDLLTAQYQNQIR